MGEMHFLAYKIHSNFNFGNEILKIFPSPYFLPSYMRKKFQHLIFLTICCITTKMIDYWCVYLRDIMFQVLGVHTLTHKDGLVTVEISLSSIVWIICLKKRFKSAHWRSNYCARPALFTQNSKDEYMHFNLSYKTLVLHRRILLSSIRHLLSAVYT